MLAKNDYEIFQKDILTKNLVFKRGINPGEEVDFTPYNLNVIIKGNIGAGAIICAPYNITVEGDVGAKATLTATQGLIVANDVHDQANLKANNSIKVASVGNEARLEAKNEIITKNIGSRCTIKSSGTMGTVRIGSVGQYSVIEAFHGIFAGDISDYSEITSFNSEVRLNHASAHAKIKALSIYFKSIDPLTQLITNGELWEQVDLDGKVFNPYKPSLTINQPVLSEKSSNQITVNIANAHLDTLAISIGALNFSTVKTIFAKDNRSNATVQMTTLDNAITYDIVGQSSPK